MHMAAAAEAGKHMKLHVKNRYFMDSVTVRHVRVVLAAEQILLFSGRATSCVYGSNDNRGLIQYTVFQKK